MRLQSKRYGEHPRCDTIPSYSEKRRVLINDQAGEENVSSPVFFLPEGKKVSENSCLYIFFAIFVCS